MKLKGRHVIWSLVFLVFGFLLTYSYQQTKNESQIIQLSDSEWEKDYFYRQQLINLEEKNRELRMELSSNRQEIQLLEEELGKQEETLGDYVELKKQLQMLTGELPIKGKGMQVTLRDSDYIPTEENANQYIVHDRHMHLVINELFSAGAKAISINGQRIYKDSFISCVGPVVSVDGVPHPAPFTIAAIGDPEVLDVSLNLTNGVVDILLSDNIEVEIEKKKDIEMRARVS
ncbi:DUF881 domain-containing protein [Aquibacillus koreensis]|uniref:DUF881 domain-containing protein n=1 Tax=Aquibacillus koreensis TaxID=279446 RepID=A0A9X4AIC3_9BACI|nr:DUF881 domain-containing protein [Aquibacillus koreensis]MCT2538056.1 DUF881 domain-containing protein [Aquibacillus koreensis]MDC3420579.1 DUF881 domain-containing protein [Aquibacillus koreensis]